MDRRVRSLPPLIPFCQVVCKDRDVRRRGGDSAWEEISSKELVRLEKDSTAFIGSFHERGSRALKRNAASGYLTSRRFSASCAQGTETESQADRSSSLPLETHLR